MGNLLVYSGIVSKIRAMEAKLLKPSQYKEISALPTVPDLFAYLKTHTPYADVLQKMDEGMLHRGDIEKVLIQSLYRDYTKLYRFSSLTQRKFLKLYLKRYEIDLINYCLRIVINHYVEPFDLNYKRPFFDKYSQISIEKLITSTTTDQLIENLKSTEYYEPLSKLRDRGAVTLFDYDLALDLYYFTTLWKDRKKVLKEKELEIFTRDCGSKIDLLNLQWIYRAKKYYEMDIGDIYSLLIPIHYKIPMETIKELAETSDMEDFYAVVQKSPYARHYNFEQKLTIEQMYEDCLYHLFTVDRRRNPYSIASVNTYLFLKEEELRKLTTAIECIRYSLSSGETMAYIGGGT